MHRGVSEGIRTGLGVVPGTSGGFRRLVAPGSEWLQVMRGPKWQEAQVAPSGRWLQAMSGSKYFGSVPGASGHAPG